MARSFLIFFCRILLLALPVVAVLYVIRVKPEYLRFDRKSEVGMTVQTEKPRTSVQQEIPTSADKVKQEESTVPRAAFTENLDTVRIARGEMLTTISYKYYGNKIFWVYLYKHNQSRITNPNNVEIGTQIIIPQAAKYDIDAKSEASIERAKKLMREIIAKNNN